MTALRAPAGSPAAAGLTTDRRLAVSGRAAVLLDVLMGLSVLAGLSWVATMAEGPAPLSWTGGYLVLVLTMVWLWVARRVLERRSGRPARRLVIAFAVLALLKLFVSDGAGSWPLFAMALLAVGASFRPRTGVALVLAVLVVQLTLFLVTGRGLTKTLSEVASTAYVFGFLLVLAWLVAEHAAQRERIGALLAEVQRGHAAEIELVLADERTRSARELHDGLGHRLSIMSMSLQFAERMRERDPGRAWEQVAAARTQAGEALTTMRRWVRALSPVRADGGSVADALDAIAESFRGTGLEVTVDAPQDGLPDQGATLFVHRFVQEGLTNVLRHSGATRVDVACVVADGSLVLSVRDDGSPGSEGRDAPTSGFGLRSLSERAADLGGSLSAAWTGEGLALGALLPVSPVSPRRLAA